MRGIKVKELRKLARLQSLAEEETKYDQVKVKPSNRVLRQRMGLFKRGLVEDPQSISAPSIIVKISKGCFRYFYHKLKAEYKTIELKLDKH